MSLANFLSMGPMSELNCLPLTPVPNGWGCVAGPRLTFNSNIALSIKPRRLGGASWTFSIKFLTDSNITWLRSKFAMAWTALTPIISSSLNWIPSFKTGSSGLNMGLSLLLICKSWAVMFWILFGFEVSIWVTLA